MDEKLQSYKLTSLSLCDKLINELKMNKDNADDFFGGELYKAYVNATDQAINKAKAIRNKLRNT